MVGAWARIGTTKAIPRTWARDYYGQGYSLGGLGIETIRATAREEKKKRLLEPWLGIREY